MQSPHNYGGSLYTGQGQRKYLTTNERSRFLEVARRCPRTEIRAFCLLLAYTGCRISEGLALSARSVELVEGFVSIRCLKKRGAAVVYREVPLPPELCRALEPCMTMSPSGALWRFSRSWGWQLVKAIMQAADIKGGPHASPKGLRHGFGLHAIRCGVPLNLVQRWLGHASIATTAIYLQAMGAEEREIAARMWERA